jgi:hypothetical protein
VKDPSKVVWLSQTTLSVDETMETVRRLRERFPELQDPPSDDICYATQNRQVAIKKVAKDADLVIVVGSANSSNSVRLVEVALEYGAKAAYRVDYAHEIEQEWLDGVETVGVTSGASVPEVLVQEVLAELAGAGYRDVEQVRTAEEDLMFSLPKELRRMPRADATGGRWGTGAVVTDPDRGQPQCTANTRHPKSSGPRSASPPGGAPWWLARPRRPRVRDAPADPHRPAHARRECGASDARPTTTAARPRAGPTGSSRSCCSCTASSRSRARSRRSGTSRSSPTRG